MNFVIEHWGELLAALLALLRALESIAKITPTDKDNKIIAVIKEFCRFG